MHAPHHTIRLLAAAGLATLAVVGPSQVGASASSYGQAADSGTNEYAALSSSGRQATAESGVNGTATVASYDGRYVVFSTAARLVRADTNRVDDVYRRDTVENRTVLVSVTKGGRLGNDYSIEPSVSADGRYVAFTTWATNLMRDRNGGTLDVLVKDLETGVLERASRTTAGRQRSGNSMMPVISGNGRFVAFQTFGAFGPLDADRHEDVYVYDRRGDRTRQASLNESGRNFRAPVLVGGISANGQKVTFGHDNAVWVRDLRVGRSTRFWSEVDDPSQPFPAGTVGRPAVSGDGQYVAFTTRSEDVMAGEGEHNGDIFRMHLASGKIDKVSVSHDGSPSTDDSFHVSLSRDGRYVGFASSAINLVPGDIPGVDTYVRDMGTGTTTMASAGPGGPGNQDSGRNAVAISPDGQTLVYETYATDLVAGGDVNDVRIDVLVWRR